MLGYISWCFKGYQWLSPVSLEYFHHFQMNVEQQVNTDVKSRWTLPLSGSAQALLLLLSWSCPRGFPSSPAYPPGPDIPPTWAICRGTSSPSTVPLPQAIRAPPSPGWSTGGGWTGGWSPPTSPSPIPPVSPALSWGWVFWSLPSTFAVRRENCGRHAGPLCPQSRGWWCQWSAACSLAGSTTWTTWATPTGSRGAPKPTSPASSSSSFS